MRIVESGVDVGEPQARLAEVLEDVPVHERRPTFAGPLGMHAVVVDVAVVLVVDEPERDEADDLAEVVEDPDPVGMLRVEIAVLPRLPLVPGELRSVSHGGVDVVADHGDVALEDRAIADDRQRVDRGQVFVARPPEDGALAARDDAGGLARCAHGA